MIDISCRLLAREHISEAHGIMNSIGAGFGLIASGRHQS